MDTNIPQASTPQTVAQPQPGPQIATPPPMSVDPKNAGGSEKKMAIWLIIGLIIIVAIVTGIYFYLSNQQKPLQSNLQTEPPKQASASENLEGDLNTVNTDNLDNEFSQVDKSLQSL